MLEKKVKHGRDALKTATEMSIHAGYSNEPGLVEWSKMQDDLMARVRAADLAVLSFGSASTLYEKHFVLAPAA